MDLFSKNDDIIGCTGTVKRQIRLIDNTQIAQQYWRIPPPQFVEVNQYICKLLQPFVIVRKKDNSLLLWVEYRKLNEKTIKDKFSLPRVEETFGVLHGSSIFSTIGL